MRAWIVGLSLVMGANAAAADPATAPQQRKETDAERRQRLQSEKASLQQLIRDAKDRAAKCRQDAADCDKLAGEAQLAQMLAICSYYRQQARDFRDLAKDLDADARKYEARIAEIDRDLAK